MSLGVGKGKISHPMENHRVIQVQLSSEQVFKEGIFYRGSRCIHNLGNNVHHPLVPRYQTLHCPGPGEQLASSNGAAGRGLPIALRLDTKGRPGLSCP